MSFLIRHNYFATLDRFHINTKIFDFKNTIRAFDFNFFQKFKIFETKQAYHCIFKTKGKRLPIWCNIDTLYQIIVFLIQNNFNKLI